MEEPSGLPFGQLIENERFVWGRGSRPHAASRSALCVCRPSRQLFINYRLKSVAHLPWRALTYRAFNTVVDDVFAFLIKMPTVRDRFVAIPCSQP